MLNQFHQDIKTIIAIKYQPYPLLRALATEMTLKAVELISVLISWIDDTYESLLAVSNIKEDV